MVSIGWDPMATRKKLESVELKPQQQNASVHTVRGGEMLGDVIKNDGWIGAITAANNGEVFDGSLRLTDGVPQLEGDPIIVRMSGDRPVVIIREDIETADDPRARRLSVAANRVSEVSRDWVPEVLEEWEQDLESSGLWHPEEFDELMQSKEKTDLQPSNVKGSQDRIQKRAATIKAVLQAGDGDVNLFERAIAATGEENRAHALRIICEAYLDGKFGKTARQFNLEGQGVIASESDWAID